MTLDLDTLLEDALQHLPPRKSEPVGPALPQRTQHHSPIEAESRFVRFCAWWDELLCQTCKHTERRFDGLFEERLWLRPEEHSTAGAKHWLKACAKPLPELTQNAVTYVRYHNITFCHKCIGAEAWPLAQSYKDGVPQ